MGGAVRPVGGRTQRLISREVASAFLASALRPLHLSGAVRLHVSHAVCAPTRHARGRGASLLTAFAELEPLCQSATGLALHDELLAVPTEGANADDLHGQAKAIRQKAGDASATDMAGGSV